MEHGTATALHEGLPSGQLFAAYLTLCAAGWLVVRWAKRRSVNRTGSALCAVCDYTVDGLPGVVCPECGSDLRRAGVIRTGRRRSVETLQLLVGWTILVPLLGLVFSGILSQFVTYYTASGTVTLAPRSQSFGYVRVVWTGEGYRRPYAVQSLQLELTVAPGGPVNQTARMHRDGATGCYRYEDEQGRTMYRRVNPETLLRWMADSGVDGSAAEVADDAGELAAVVQDVGDVSAGRGASRLATVSKRHVETPAGTGPYFHVACLVTWSAVWLAGVHVILWRRRRAQSALRARPEVRRAAGRSPRGAELAHVAASPTRNGSAMFVPCVGATRA